MNNHDPTDHETAAQTTSIVVRLFIVVVVGIGVGAATSLLQRDLNAPWESLVNAASPWLTPMFLMGALWRRPRFAASAGLATGLLELVGYYATATIRGYPAGGSLIVFWTLCAVVGGPVFGVAGGAWWSAVDRFGNLATAVLPASFLAEAAISYGLRLHYRSSAILFAVIGLLAFGLLGLRRRHYGRIAAWLVLVLPAGLLAELVLGLIYNQAF
jgi:hypothetical protein